MIDSLHGILHGLMIAGQPINLLYTLVGVFIGTMISHLPGIGPSAGIALLIPITFGMNPTTALIFVAVPVAQLALSFGPAEYFALMIFALSTVSALTGNSLAKGLLSTSLGLAISSIGLDLQS